MYRLCFRIKQDCDADIYFQDYFFFQLFRHDLSKLLKAKEPTDFSIIMSLGSFPFEKATKLGNLSKVMMPPPPPPPLTGLGLF